MSKNILNYISQCVSKKLKVGTYNRLGINFSGKICVFHRGGGNKHFYRVIDFYRRLNAFGLIYGISYDPNRSAHLGLILYDNGVFSNIIISDGVLIGGKIFSGTSAINKLCLKKGSSLPISNIGVFSIVNNIEVRPKFGAAIARAAGAGAVVVSATSTFATMKLRSGWFLKVSPDSIASIGYVSNMLHNMSVIGKAGKNRGLGKRPVVRGVAMNPCDHPHGGGNGKTSPPSSPVTPWGKITKWVHSKSKKVDKLKRRLFKKIR